MNNQFNLFSLYKFMFEKMGDPKWWPADSSEEIILGAILVQNTNWNNVTQSLLNLKALTSFLPENILKLSQEELIQAIKPSGFYNNKSKSILSIFNWLKNYNFNYEKINSDCKNLRTELLKIFGIGEETADSLLLYVFNQKVFISDTYSQKLFTKLGCEGVSTYKLLRDRVDLSKEFSVRDAQIFHGLIIEFCKNYLKSDETFNASFLANKKLFIG